MIVQFLQSENKLNKNGLFIIAGLVIIIKLYYENQKTLC